MLTLLTARLNKTEVNEPRYIFWLAVAEVLIFDVPVAVMLFIMWRSI